MSTIASLDIDLGFDSRRLKKGKQEAVKEVGGIGKLLRGAFSTGLGVLGADIFSGGVAGIKNAIFGATGAASDLAETLSKSDTVFGKNAQMMRTWAEDAETNFGMTDQAALGFAATLGNLFKGVGLGAADTAKFSKNMVQAAADLGSFNNIEPGIVLEKLRAGLTGEAEPLKELGILLNESAVATELQRLGLDKLTGAQLEAAKVQARYNLIMGQIGDAQGDYAKTADGAANGARTLTAFIGGLRTELGAKLLPIQTKVIRTSNQFLRSWADLRKRGINPVRAAFMALRGVLTPGTDAPNTWSNLVTSIENSLYAFARAIRQTWATVRPILGFIVKHFDDIGPAAIGAVAAVLTITKVIPAIKAVRIALLGLRAGVLGVSWPLLAVIALVALVAVAWSKNWFDIRGKTAKVVGFLGRMLARLIDWLDPVISVVTKLGRYFLSVATGAHVAGEAFADLPGWLRPVAFVFGRIIKTVRVFFKTWQDRGFVAALMTIPNQIKAFGGAVAGLADQLLGSKVGDLVYKQFSEVAKIVRNAILLVRAVIDGDWGEVWERAKRIGVTFIGVVIRQYQLFGTMLVAIFQRIPWGKIGSFLWSGFTAAAGWFFDTAWPWIDAKGEELFAALLTALVRKWQNDIAPWLGDRLKAIEEKLGNWYDRAYGWGASLISGIWDAITRNWETVKTWFGDNLSGDAIGRRLGNWYASAWGWGSSLLQGIIDGITAGWESFKSWLSGLWDQVPGWAKKAWDMASPSKVFRRIGRGAPDGLIMAWKDRAGALRRTVSNAMTTAVPPVDVTAGATAGNAVGMRAGNGAAAGSTQTARTFIIEKGAIVVYSNNGEQVARDLLRYVRQVEAMEA